MVLTYKISFCLVKHSDSWNNGERYNLWAPNVYIYPIYLNLFATQHQYSSAFMIIFFNIYFICLTALGLSHCVYDHWSSLQHAEILNCDIWTFRCSTWDLNPWKGIKPRLPVLGALSLSNWTTREAPFLSHLNICRTTKRLSHQNALPAEAEHVTLCLLVSVLILLNSVLI